MTRGRWLLVLWSLGQALAAVGRLQVAKVAGLRASDDLRSAWHTVRRPGSSGATLQAADLLATHHRRSCFSFVLPFLLGPLLAFGFLQHVLSACTI